MGLIRCLAIFSSVGVGLVIILATQLASSGNPTYLGVVIALSVVCLLSLCLLLYKLMVRSEKCPFQRHPIDGHHHHHHHQHHHHPDDLEAAIAKDTEQEEDSRFLTALSGVPSKFTFKDLQIATSGFCKLLGRGGFGSVYEGQLEDGTRVAVKRLDTESRLRSREFTAEVATISGIHHVNLVRLLGFCAEGTHRLLVYEFMENGSLDKWLFSKRAKSGSPLIQETKDMEKKVGVLGEGVSKSTDMPRKKGETRTNAALPEKQAAAGMEKRRLEEAEKKEKQEKEKEKEGGMDMESPEPGTMIDREGDEDSKPVSSSDVGGLTWARRYQIALETARGLAYLHEECRDTILHLDVKPQNILLDARFHAKVSDFGLSRAMDREQSRLVTSMRGTPGYLAPEWLINAGITHKSDVYSFGMVLLELVSGRRNVDHSQDSSAWYFPTLAFRHAQEMKMDEIIDPTLRNSGGMSHTDMEQAHIAIRIAFWCIQDSVATRPSMSTIVRMLEGNQLVLDPPLTGVFSFTNVLVRGGGVEGSAGVLGGLGGVCNYLNQPPLEQAKKTQHVLLQEQQQFPHPTLSMEEPLSISIDSSTPDSPLPPPPCR